MTESKNLSTESFNSLSLADRYSWISQHGKYVGVRSYYNHSINLYTVEDSFYELWYFRPKNRIVKIEPLIDLKKIDLYIKYMQELDKS